MIPEAFSAIVHHLAPSMARKLLQYRPANPGSIIKLDILPIKDYLDPRNLGWIPTPSPRQQAAEQNITHAAPHDSPPDDAAIAGRGSVRPPPLRRRGHLPQSTCCNREAIASNSGSGLRLSDTNIRNVGRDRFIANKPQPKQATPTLGGI
jgi:hypothetical protein